jgi:SAM-dependent methyltransferase
MAIVGNWYDYPRWFDLAFRDETPDEVAFLVEAAKRYAHQRVRSWLDLGCGSGRLTLALARLGYRLTAIDRNPHMLAYAERKLRSRNLQARLMQADMANFTLAGAVDAAYCTFNTFRHLLTEREARAHLACVARAVRPGGVYVLGLHLLPLDVAEESEERWRARRGATRLNATLRVIQTNRRKRVERLRLSMRIRTLKRELRLRSEFELRMYTPRQFRSLLAHSPDFQMCDVFDFWHDIEHPQELDDDRVDTVVVLRRR